MKPLFAEYPRHVAELVRVAVETADPVTAVQKHLSCHERILTVGDTHFDLDGGRVFLVSVGKAAVPMGKAAAEILGEDLAGGVILTKKGARAVPFSAQHPALLLLVGGHPVSDEDSVAATAAVTEFLAQATVGDLVIYLISGGTSALLTQPLIPLADWQTLTKALLASGCTIQELNCVRRQLDRVKGGGLARLSAPATAVSLILSDVVGNPLADIGSGPTVLVEETPAAALAVLQHYQIAGQLEPVVWQRIEAILSQPAQAPRKVVASEQVIIGDIQEAATAVFTKAAQLGFLTQILTTQLEGEAREVGKFVAAIAKELPPARCLILGGETTVTLRGDGIGGRNQEVALATAVALAGHPCVVVASFATDGEDSTTGMAGAMVTGATADLAQQNNLNPRVYLANNDSFTFFQQLDDALRGNDDALQGNDDALQGNDDALRRNEDALQGNEEMEENMNEAEMEPSPVTPQPASLIYTGPTGTNVNDLIIILTY
jgi:hydroxypyruvate reductase